MFLLISRYVKSLEEADRVLPEHREFLDRHYASGAFLVSGPFVPRAGGVIVTAELSRDEVDRILADDPFVREGISEYEIREFRPTKMNAALAGVVSRGSD